MKPIAADVRPATASCWQPSVTRIAFKRILLHPYAAIHGACSRKLPPAAIHGRIGILVDKAEGKISTNIGNHLPDAQADGIDIYAPVFKWFTETSGLGLAEKARRLMDRSRARKEEEIGERLEEWEEKCNRLAKLGK